VDDEHVSTTRNAVQPIEAVRAFVDAFIAAWAKGNAESLASFFSEDAVYHNMPMEPVRGKDQIVATLTDYMAMGGSVGVDLRHIVADGPIVMTERIDHLSAPNATVSLPVMGIFEVRGGTITAWRDYFDSAQFAAQNEHG
jgi:limonene-1,2-epoxide hydrolase